MEKPLNTNDTVFTLQEATVHTFFSPSGNPEVWPERPAGYLTADEWFTLHPVGLDDTRTPKEKREDAYKAEADPLFEQAMFYQAEAEGFRLLNDLASAAVAEEKSRDYLRQYAEKKAEIRERYPDEEVT